MVHGHLAVRDGKGRGFGAEPVADLEFGSYQTAWAMFHRLRSVLVRPGRERLSDRVEVDETFIAEVEPGLRGGRQRAKKSHWSSWLSRCTSRTASVVVRCGSSKTRRLSRYTPSCSSTSSRGTAVITDGWQG